MLILILTFATLALVIHSFRLCTITKRELVSSQQTLR